MRKLAIVLLLSVTASGCVVRARGRMNPVASILVTGLAVAAVANAMTVSVPPPVTYDVGYYGYHRPGYVWVNGRHTWNGSAWAWSPGYYQGARANQYWVQGSWEQRGNQYAWVDGYWADPRPGYVYVDGYYDATNNGYQWRSGRWETQRAGQVYVQGSWSNTGGRRTWNQGGWQQGGGYQNPNYNNNRSTVRANGGVNVTPR
jgi:WXXGXW repeat (2 copies)